MSVGDKKKGFFFGCEKTQGDFFSHSMKRPPRIRIPSPSDTEIDRRDLMRTIFKRAPWTHRQLISPRSETHLTTLLEYMNIGSDAAIVRPLCRRYLPGHPPQTNYRFAD